MAFRIEFTERVNADIEELSDGLMARHAGPPGLRWLDGLVKAVDHLRVMPERCLRYRNDRRLPYEVRQLFYRRKPHVFGVLFRIDADTIYILRIRRGTAGNPLS